MIKTLLIALIALFGTGACSKKENQKVSQQKILDLAKQVDPSIIQMAGLKPEDRVFCKEYGPECVSAIKMRHKGLTFDIIEFDTLEMALKNAKKIDAFYFMNFVFDEVTGEPILEEYIKKTYGAVRPLKEGDKLFFTIPQHKTVLLPESESGGKHGGGGHH